MNYGRLSLVCRFFFTALVSSLLLPKIAAAQITCPAPPQQISTDVAGDIEGQFDKLGPIEGPQIHGAVKTITVNLMAKYPNADKLYLAQLLMSVTCNFVKNSDLSDQDKLLEINNLTNEILESFSEKHAALPPKLVPTYFLPTKASDGTFRQFGLNFGKIEFYNEGGPIYDVHADIIANLNLSAQGSTDGDNIVMFNTVLYKWFETSESGLEYLRTTLAEKTGDFGLYPSADEAPLSIALGAMVGVAIANSEEAVRAVNRPLMVMLYLQVHVSYEGEDGGTSDRYYELNGGAIVDECHNPIPINLTHYNTSFLDTPHEESSADDYTSAVNSLTQYDAANTSSPVGLPYMTPAAGFKSGSQLTDDDFQYFTTAEVINGVNAVKFDPLAVSCPSGYSTF